MNKPQPIPSQLIQNPEQQHDVQGASAAAGASAATTLGQGQNPSHAQEGTSKELNLLRTRVADLTKKLQLKLESQQTLPKFFLTTNKNDANNQISSDRQEFLNEVASLTSELHEILKTVQESEQMASLGQITIVPQTNNFIWPNRPDSLLIPNSDPTFMLQDVAYPPLSNAKINQTLQVNSFDNLTNSQALKLESHLDSHRQTFNDTLDKLLTSQTLISDYKHLQDKKKAGVNTAAGNAYSRRDNLATCEDQVIQLDEAEKSDIKTFAQQWLLVEPKLEKIEVLRGPNANADSSEIDDNDEEMANTYQLEGMNLGGR